MPARSTRPLPGSRRAPHSWPRPGGSSSGPCPTAHPAAHGTARRSTCSARRSGYSRSIAATMRRVERTSPLLEEAPVGDLVGEGMLERVLEVGKEPRLIEELSGLEPVESPVELVVGELSDRLEKPERDVFPDHRRGLQQAFVFGRDPIDAGRQDRLDRRRHLDGLRALRQPVRARAPRPAPWSPRASARSPRGRAGCLPSARSAPASMVQDSGRTRASRARRSSALSAGRGSIRSCR